MVLKSESETPFPLASTMTGASPPRTAVTKKAVLVDPRAGTVTRTRRNNSISGEGRWKVHFDRAREVVLPLKIKSLKDVVASPINRQLEMRVAIM